MKSFFPFDALGFIGNPFQTLTDEQWMKIAVLPPSIETALASHYHIQIMGDMGRGKSTTLRGIYYRLQTEDGGIIYEYIPQHQHRFHTSLKNLKVLILDEIQRLWFWEKLRLLNFCRRHSEFRLIFASHKDLSGWFNYWNLPLITISVQDISSDQLAQILKKRLEIFRNENPPVIDFEASAIRFLEIEFGSNRRQMERFLYEYFQSLKYPALITNERLHHFLKTGHSQTHQPLQR